MNKEAFLDALRKKLSGLPEADVEDRLNFYSEMIDDRMEEGLSEEEAVLEIGMVEEIAEQVLADIPLTKLVKEKIKPQKKQSGLAIILLILGLPIWLPLLIAGLAIVFALYVTLWALMISLWAVLFSLIAGAFGGVVIGLVSIFKGVGLNGFAMLCAAVVCAGLVLLVYEGCKAAAKGIIKGTKKLITWMKRCFIKREKEQ